MCALPNPLFTASSIGWSLSLLATVPWHLIGVAAGYTRLVVALLRLPRLLRLLWLYDLCTQVTADVVGRKRCARRYEGSQAHAPSDLLAPLPQI